MVHSVWRRSPSTGNQVFVELESARQEEMTSQAPQRGRMIFEVRGEVEMVPGTVQLVDSKYSVGQNGKRNAIREGLRDL